MVDSTIIKMRLTHTQAYLHSEIVPIFDAHENARAAHAHTLEGKVWTDGESEGQGLKLPPAPVKCAILIIEIDLK